MLSNPSGTARGTLLQAQTGTSSLPPACPQCWFCEFQVGILPSDPSFCLKIVTFPEFGERHKSTQITLQNAKNHNTLKRHFNGWYMQTHNQMTSTNQHMHMFNQHDTLGPFKCFY